MPIAAVLRDHLTEHKMQTGRENGLLWSRSSPDGLDVPLLANTIYARARKAWKDAELDPIGLHECRHTFASLMIAAGVNVKALSEFMGHATFASRSIATATCCPAPETKPPRC